MAGGTSAGMGRDGLQGLFAPFKLLRTRRLQNLPIYHKFLPICIDGEYNIFFFTGGFILMNLKILGPVHTGSQVPQSLWGQSVRSQPLRSWKLGLTISHGVPSPRSQVWHGCLHIHPFGMWGPGLVLRVGSLKKLDLKAQHKSCEFFGHKDQWRSDFDESKPCFNGFIRFESREFASMLGLVDVSGTWDPMWNCP